MPSGSIRAWQPAQLAADTWESTSDDAVSPSPESGRTAFTFGGGGGAGRLKIFSRIHTPRRTGEVRVLSLAEARKAAVVTRPPRRPSGNFTLRSVPPLTGGKPANSIGQSGHSDGR